MKPKKAKELIPKVAEKLGYSEELIQEVVNFYWRELRRSVSSMEHSRIHVANLGDFKIKHWKLDKKIEDFERFEESNRQKGLQQMTARFNNAENLYKLKQLKSIIDEENQRKQFVKLHKSVGNEIEEKSDKDMEK